MELRNCSGLLLPPAADSVAAQKINAEGAVVHEPHCWICRWFRPRGFRIPSDTTAADVPSFWENRNSASFPAQCCLLAEIRQPTKKKTAARSSSCLEHIVEFVVDVKPRLLHFALTKKTPSKYVARPPPKKKSRVNRLFFHFRNTNSHSKLAPKKKRQLNYQEILRSTGN